MATEIHHGRRQFLQVAAALVIPRRAPSPGTLFQTVRRIVNSGRLGPIAYTSAWGGFGDLVPFALDLGRPQSISAEPGIVTLRYPSLVSFVDTGTARNPGATLHGAAATLTVTPDTCQLHTASRTYNFQMAIEWVRKLCKSFPHTTEEVLWGNDLVFKIGGKMYAVMPVDFSPLCLSFKAGDEEFAELCELDGVIPAPYLARSRWVALERENAIPAATLKRLIRQSYDLVRAKLPKKVQAALT